jgi:DNA-binding transcriptional ArsR family regulator
MGEFRPLLQDIEEPNFIVEPPIFRAWDGKNVDFRSFAMVPIRPIFDRSISHATFRVFVGLCSFMNRRRRTTYVGQIKLAKTLGVSQPTISRHIRSLRNAGYITYGKWDRSISRAQPYFIPFCAPTGPSTEEDTAEYEAAEARHFPNELPPPVPLSGIHTDSEKSDNTPMGHKQPIEAKAKHRGETEPGRQSSSIKRPSGCPCGECDSVTSLTPPKIGD